jgi:anti-sigma factor RsiW
MAVLPCAVCEAMCLDAADGTLTPAETAALDRHVAGCTHCAAQLAEAQRGAAWMEMLKAQRPEPPADMLQRILTATAEVAAEQQLHVAAAQPAVTLQPAAPPPARLAPWGRARAQWTSLSARFSTGGGGYATAFQPRMAMTAAMAFFSLALTMNLSGIRLTDLRPSQLHRTIADTGAGISRSVQNMRVVYQLESRVDELRGNGVDRDDNKFQRDPSGPYVDGDSNPAPQQKQNAQPQDEPKQDTPKGTSELQPLTAPTLERTGYVPAGATHTGKGV